MRFLVDNNLSPRFAHALATAGHDAIHVRELNLGSAADAEIFAVAARERRVLVAQDADFSALLALREEQFPSVFLFRCRSKSTDALLTLLLSNLPAVIEDLSAGAVVVLSDSRIRVRRLPIIRRREEMP